MAGDLTHRIITNTAWSGLGQIVRLAQPLVLTPYLLHRLGVERFAVWSLALVLASYFALLDFGVGAALTKRVAQHIALGREEALRVVASTGLGFYVMAVAVLSPLLYVARHWIVSLFHVPSSILSEAQFTLVGTIVVIGITQVSGSITAILIGFQRMDLTNLVQIGTALLRLLGSFAAVGAGYGLRGLIIVDVVVYALGMSVLAAMTRRLLPMRAMTYRYVRWREMRAMLQYGLKVQASQALGVASLHVGRIVLGLYAGLAAVAYYEVGDRLVQGAKSLALVLTSTVVPVASELDGTAGVAGLRRLYQRGMKYLLLVSVPLMGFGVAAAPALIGAWLGSESRPVVMALQLLCVGNFVHVLTAMGTKVSRGIGRPGLETRYVALLFVSTVLLDLVAVQILGYEGVLVSTAVALATSSVYFLVSFHRQIGLGGQVLKRRAFVVPVVAGSLAGLSAGSIYPLARCLVPMTGRATYLAVVGAQWLVYLTIYGACIARGGYWDSDDRRIWSRLRRVVLGER